MAAIVVTCEKRSGTLQRLFFTTVTTRTVILGKAAGAAIYGIAICLVITAGLVFLVGIAVANAFMLSLSACFWGPEHFPFWVSSPR